MREIAMPRPAKSPTVESVSGELAEHFEQAVGEKPDQTKLQAVQFSLHARGSLALIKLPYLVNTPEFGIACRSFRRPAEDAGVTCLFFDAKQTYESFAGDNDFNLAKLGLMRIPKKA